MRALIVDDDTSLRLLWRQALEGSGVEVTEAGCVEGAIEQMRLSKFDVFVVDLLLPDGNGFAIADYAAYSAIQANVIVITGSGLYPSGEAFNISPNISFILRKPVAINDLVCLVKHTAFKTNALH